MASCPLFDAHTKLMSTPAHRSIPSIVAMGEVRLRHTNITTNTQCWVRKQAHSMSSHHPLSNQSVDRKRTESKRNPMPTKIYVKLADAIKGLSKKCASYVSMQGFRSATVILRTLSTRPGIGLRALVKECIFFFII